MPNHPIYSSEAQQGTLSFGTFFKIILKILQNTKGMLAGFSFELSLGIQIIIYNNDFKASTRQGRDIGMLLEVNYAYFLDEAKT